MTQAISLDLTGMRFGRLTALRFSRVHRTPKGSATMWMCVCDCGVEKEYRLGALRSGKTISCGCALREAVIARNYKHGLAKKVDEYTIWKNMRQRCRNSRHPDYKNYGGRGIRVCERWDTFAHFLADMGPRPDKTFSIERIDVNGDYEPANCCWIPTSEQSRNRRCVLARRAA